MLITSKIYFYEHREDDNFYTYILLRSTLALVVNKGDPSGDFNIFKKAGKIHLHELEMPNPLDQNPEEEEGIFPLKLNSHSNIIVEDEEMKRLDEELKQVNNEYNTLRVKQNEEYAKVDLLNDEISEIEFKIQELEKLDQYFKELKMNADKITQDMA